ncbi:MAG: sensor histidine kinase [Brevundimonas sp.]|nr:MAG: sensor histidine kinase [Brevundimonas sp.]
MAIGETAATNLALVLHELATNSVKHGALSVDAGLLDVACRVDGGVAAIVWTERGGPRVKAPAASKGFGSQLLGRVIKHHFGGSVDYDWSAEGLIATLRIPADRLGV